jgi:type I restriction enzyme M protein
MGTRFEDIKNTLWKAADTFRGTIDAANYKDFVLSMLFIKYLDDTYEEYEEELKKKYDNPIRLERAKRNLPFTLQDYQRFRYLHKNRHDPKIGEMINMALQGIEDDNNELRGVSAALILIARQCWEIHSKRIQSFVHYWKILRLLIFVRHI